MARTGHRHYLIVIGLLGLTGWLITCQRDTLVTGKTGIKSALPEYVGKYRGMSYLFCQNVSCMKQFPATAVNDEAICPDCSGRLDAKTFGENSALPADTIILKKFYKGPGESKIFVSVVFSGKEQKSIHRPQQCLPAAGYTIETGSVISVPIEGREPLKVMLLSARRMQNDSWGYMSSYAYWFVGVDRETPYHLERLFWMSADRVVHNVAHGWAYVAVAMERTTWERDDHEEQISSFIRTLYPLIVK